MKPHPLTMPILNIWYWWSLSPPWLRLFWIYDMDEAPPHDFCLILYWWSFTLPPPLIMPILNIWYGWSPPPPWLCLLWIYDMDEASPPPPDYAYYEYMIWIKAPPDYAYYEYMTWMKPPLTTPIMNIWYGWISHLTMPIMKIWYGFSPTPWQRLFWIYDLDEAPSPDYAYSEYMICMKPPPL
jgi:hypothetical protein